jgi:pyruvate dehydrogenase E2 component (dihydrolipoamide acetyltransferase)
VVAVVGEPGEAPAAVAAPAAAPRRKSISPRARKFAEEHGIDWQSLAGTGADGQVTQQDVERAVAAAPKPQAAGEPLPRHRQIIAARLTASLRERAHIHLTVTIDMTEAVALRGRRPEVSYNALMVKALAACLAEFPAVNDTLLDGTLRRNASAHIGLAVAAGDDALLVPVIREAEKKTLEQIAAEARSLAGKARAGHLTPDEMTGGTFTLSNLGMYGVEQFTAIINPPETGILAAGAVCEEPRAVNGSVAIRPVCRVTLAVDHRVVDGALAARFLARFKQIMECPA